MNIERPVSNPPIPPHAKKVFSGKIFDVYQWEQRLYDGTSATFEKIKRIDTVGIIPITVDKKIIITEQEQPGMKPFIGFPGGRIDEREDPLSAAKRELREETGYEGNEYILWDASQYLSKIDWAIYTFIAKDCKKTAEQHLDSGEKITIRYVTFEELLQLVFEENFRDRETALKILQLKNKPKKFAEMKEMFM